mgnify:CR=1 FL=1
MLENEEENHQEETVFETHGLVHNTKKITKYFSGIPQKLTNIKGKIENVCCGDLNSYAVVKL